MKEVINICCGIALIISTFSCGNNQGDDPSIIFNLGDELQMTVWEDINTSDNTLNFTFSTIERLDCENTQINYSYKYNLSTILIDLNNISTIGDCIAGESYANTNIEITSIPDHVKDYEVKINLKNAFEIKGNISEDPLQYKLNIPNKSGINLTYSNLKKILPFMVWGSIELDNEQDQFIIDQFLSDLSVISQENKIGIGQYYYFRVEDDNEVSVADPEVIANGTDFSSYILEDTGAFQALIEDYRSTFGNRVIISGRDWLGKVY